VCPLRDEIVFGKGLRIMDLPNIFTIGDLLAELEVPDNPLLEVARYSTVHQKDALQFMSWVVSAIDRLK
jgi:hypothetical protein